MAVDDRSTGGRSDPGRDGQGRDSARINPSPMALPGAGRLRPPIRVLDHTGKYRVLGASNPPAQGPMQRLAAALELAWRVIQEHHAEIPDVVVTVGSGGGHRAGVRKLGHFAAGRWRRADGDAWSEILVAGEGLDRGPEGVLATLLHEAAHALAFARRVCDTSKNGRYHNRRFAKVATELGLQVGMLPPYGFAATHLTPAVGRRYAVALRELDEALVLWRQAEPRAGRAGRQRRSSTTCRCACPRRLRLPDTAISEAPIICGRCGEPFLPAVGSSG
jgi:hypothetical protein